MTFKVNIETVSKYSSSGSGCTTFGDFAKITAQNVVVQHTRGPGIDAATQSEKPFLRACLENAPEAFIVTSASGVIQLVNRCAISLLGYHEEELRGQKLTLLLDPNFKPASPPRDKTASPYWIDLHDQSGTLRARKKSGELFPAEIRKRQCLLPNSIVHIYYIRDVSAAHRYEQRIAELEREMGHLARHSILGELATSITHELSQPLTAIANYTAAASRCGAEATPEELENSLDLIAKAGEQAKRAWLIMHRLRQLLQHRDAERVEDDLRLAVEEAVQLATLGAAQQGIEVTVDLPPEPVILSMDRVQIQMLLANLVRNAVDELRSVDGERKIRISLSVNDRMAEVSVADTGHGIAPEVFENIFDPFHTTKAEGLGVGLALSRRIAQAHGGRLSAANLPDRGAIFSFVVPVA